MAKQYSSSEEQSVRIDKWLWAARFFKTRSLAKTAIESGKVRYRGERVKVSKEVYIGMELSIQQGHDKKTVIVQALSDVRGSAPIAQQLYQETEESITQRTQQAEQRKLFNQSYNSPHRPTKKDRRDLQRFLHQQESSNFTMDDE